jgi:1,2-diacylglycerol 3-alpha-glucosyltransferase
LSKKFNNIKFLVIGDGPDLDNMKNIASHSDFHNSVIFAGKIPFTEIPLYYQLGDLFLTASKTETQGLTVIEAMSASIPVICIEDESFVDIVVSGLNGYTFRTKRQCRTVIADLYNDKEKLNNLKKQARITGSLHSSKYYAERILDVYNIAINNYKNRKPSLFDRIKGVVMK